MNELSTIQQEDFLKKEMFIDIVVRPPLKNFYTILTMEDLLFDELTLDRECYIYCEQKLITKPRMFVHDLRQVSQEGLLDYFGGETPKIKELVKRRKKRIRW